MLLTTKEMKEVESTLAERLKVDYPNFSDDFFRRRLAYVFDKMHFHRVQDLQMALGSLVAFDEITYYLAVPQTELFRFPSFWRRLIKILAEEKNLKSIWLPSLTSYHELFSLLIALQLAGRADCEITANVVSDRITRDCQRGVMSKKDDAQNLTNYQRLEPTASYDDYVIKNAEGYGLKPGLIDGVTFRNGWFLNCADEKTYDVVICRDVMLCYNEKLTCQASAKLVDSLAGPGSILGIGAMERPLGQEARLDAEHSPDGLYRLV